MAFGAGQEDQSLNPCLEKMAFEAGPLRSRSYRVPIVAQQVMNLTSIPKDAISIPGFAQWVKEPVLL